MTGGLSLCFVPRQLHSTGQHGSVVGRHSTFIRIKRSFGYTQAPFRVPTPLPLAESQAIQAVVGVVHGLAVNCMEVMRPLSPEVEGRLSGFDVSVPGYP